MYPLRYTEDFFAKFDEVAARISSTAAEDTFETSSSYQPPGTASGAQRRWIEPRVESLGKVAAMTLSGQTWGSQGTR